MPTYSDAELLTEIRRVADITDDDGAPSVSEFNTHSDINDSTIYRRFGSWNDGVAAAGFEPNPSGGAIADDALLDELHRLRAELGHIPTVPEMNSNGAYWASTYKHHFGSWTDALVVAFDDIDSVDALNQYRAATADTDASSGVPHLQEHTDETLLEELHRLAAEHHDPPRITDVREHSSHGARTYTRRFGSWTKALKAAGFEPQHTGRVSTDDLLADLHRLRDELGAYPTATDVVEKSDHSIATYQRRFGSWSAALETAFDNIDSA